MRSFRSARVKPGKLIPWGVFLGLLTIIGVLLILSQAHPKSVPENFGDLIKVDDHPLYVMHYQGDYGFEQFLKTGIGRESSSMPSVTGTSRWACTGFSALTWSGERLFGRNFDWYDDPALLLFTDPPGAYASVSMVDLSYLGFNSGEPGQEALAALSEAPYLPFDGMNEKGLAVGMMAVPNAEPGTDPEKVTLDSLQVMRLVLDYASSVDEAIDWFGQFNINFGDGPPLHYLLADGMGYSAVIEFLEGQMVVTRNEEPWQAATNFILAGRDDAQARSSCDRYRTVAETLQQAGGNLAFTDAMSLLANVSQSNTIWSIVYDLHTGDIQIVMGRAYGRGHQFQLDMNP